ncbi:hypothetical protein R1flu_023723 [Riccia fluitans]|uniref:Uncharacterized protein n=1 Tax=Riccia fluitans TaxID=41844 RepID=A0ABD1XVT2_9MARC
MKRREKCRLCERVLAGDETSKAWNGPEQQNVQNVGVINERRGRSEPGRENDTTMRNHERTNLALRNVGKNHQNLERLFESVDHSPELNSCHEARRESPPKRHDSTTRPNSEMIATRRPVGIKSGAFSQLGTQCLFSRSSLRWEESEVCSFPSGRPTLHASSLIHRSQLKSRGIQQQRLSLGDVVSDTVARFGAERSVRGRSSRSEFLFLSFGGGEKLLAGSSLHVVERVDSELPVSLVITLPPDLSDSSPDPAPTGVIRRECCTSS